MIVSVSKLTYLLPAVEDAQGVAVVWVVLTNVEAADLLVVVGDGRVVSDPDRAVLQNELHRPGPSALVLSILIRHRHPRHS